MDQETFYTHTNKKVFLSNEELWFKTYIYNTKSHTPYLSTTNVYVSIFNNEGVLIKKEIFYSNNGMAHGNFQIDDSYPPGDYFLKTDTSWSRNFNENHSNIQQFSIISKQNVKVKTSKLKTKYDFQLLPEQGYFLNDAINSIGFKLINNQGESEIIKHGKVIDESNNLLTTFKSNKFGLGKFSLNIRSDKNYIVEIELENGDTISKKIKEIKKEGIALKIDNSNEDILKISIVTNQLTLNKISGQTYFVALHRDGNIETFKIELNKKKLQYEITIPKKLLLPAINIITLFNNKNKPISERIIFNNALTPIKNIELKQVVYHQDSSLVTYKIKNNSIKSNFSISALPFNNESNKIENSISSTFLLAPYVKGTIENSNYYFENVTRKKLYNLDLLLLTQGWSKFSWSNIFNNHPKPTHVFENGFQITGKLNDYNYKKGDELILLSKYNGIQLNQKLDDSKFFNFENLFLSDSSQVSFSLKNRKGKLIKPKAYYNTYPIFTKESFNSISTEENTTSTIHHIENEFIVNPENLLDTVKLRTVYSKVKIKNKVIGDFYGKRITFEDAPSPRSLITNIIRFNGFKVVNYGFSVRISSRRGGKTAIFIDNTQVYDTGLLASLTVDDVQEIFFSHVGYLTRGSVIRIFLKKTGNTKLNNQYSNSIVKFGYSNPKEYYSPMYKTNNSQAFEKYGVINWIPNIETNALGEFTFKLPNTSENVNLYIEGMGEDGSLYSLNETIRLGNLK